MALTTLERELLKALDAARIELRNGQTELEFGRDTRRAKNEYERLGAMTDSTDRVVRGHEQAIQAIDALVMPIREAEVLARKLVSPRTCGATGFSDVAPQSSCTRDYGHAGDHRCSAADVDDRAIRASRAS